MIATICLEGIRIYAHHGVSEAERALGGPFDVSVELDADIKSAGFHDDLRQTIDYQWVFDLVQAEMQQPRKLLETLVVSICGKLFGHNDAIKRVRVRICKLDPPLGGTCQRACVEYTVAR
jgi:dihydroneopterin aldolase